MRLDIRCLRWFEKRIINALIATGACDESQALFLCLDKNWGGSKINGTFAYLTRYKNIKGEWGINEKGEYLLWIGTPKAVAVLLTEVHK